VLLKVDPEKVDPFTIVKLSIVTPAPKVVVPEESIKLLNVVKMVAGIVLFDLKTIVPFPGVKVEEVVDLPTAKPPHINLPPLVMFKAPIKLSALGPPNVIFLVTVNALPILKFSVAVPLVEGAKFIAAQTAVDTSTVTVLPPAIITESELVGKVEPLQFVARLQFPVLAVNVFCALT
jgi:hypothetical protein